MTCLLSISRWRRPRHLGRGGGELVVIISATTARAEAATGVPTLDQALAMARQSSIEPSTKRATPRVTTRTWEKVKKCAKA